MKKIGILTFHKVDNYGAVLQTLALQEAINNLGEKAFVVDYFPNFMKKSTKIFQPYSIKSFFKNFLFLKKFFIKRKKFIKFRERYLSIVGKNLKAKEILIACKEIDVFVLGSDQIWNPNITYGVDPTYYGVFSGEYHESFSYAASIGVSILKAEEKKYMSKLVSRLKKISVREEEAAKLLSLEKYSVVCDPVLLHDKSFWINIFNIHKKEETPYIFLYALTGYKETYDMAKILSKITGYKVIEVRNIKKIKKEIEGENILFSVSPEKFIELIANSSYVVTDSFHGTAFSIIFEKEMFVIPNKEKGNRMISLMTKLGIKQRIIDKPNKISEYTINQPIDFVLLRKLREQMKKDSIKFLTEALKD